MIRSIISRFLFPGVFILISIVHVNAQQYTIRGTVVDADKGEAVEFATVQLLTGSANTFVGYGITDQNGVFTIRGSRTDSLRIVISSIGYKPYEQAVKPGDDLKITLETDPFVLDEVVVRPGRVWSRSDTVNYDVDRFMSSRDRTIRDVLERLPGIDVSEQGKISYQGKDISNLYIEGMDPVGGRYNQITSNLRAEAVQTVQVLENHQSVRMLEDLVPSEDVALNLKLKAEFQAVWMFTLEGGIGMSPLLWTSTDNAIRLSRTNQSIFSYRGNNTGNDLLFDQSMMGMIRQTGLFSAPSTPSFTSMPSIMAPLKKERLLFNNAHSLSANRLYKLDETTRLRITGNYTHDERRQERGSETILYMAGDTARISEMSNTKLYSDEATLGINIENNSPNQYLTNNFSAYGNWNSGVSNYTGNPMTNQQRLNSTSMGASNDFRTLWGKKDYRYELKSLLRYDHKPEELRTDSINQNTLFKRFYTDNSFSISAQKRYSISQLNVGLNTDVNNLQTAINPYVSPSLQWNKDPWQTRFSLPVVWTNYPGANFSRISARPSANIAYKPNYAWRFTLSAGFREQYGDILNFYGSPYYTDYRNIVVTPEKLPVQQIQNYNLYGEYKKTASEFFASLSLTYMLGKNSHISEQKVENGYISVTPIEMSNLTTNRRIAGTVSKGFYDLKLNTSLSAQFSQNEGERFSNGVKLPFQSNRINLEPKINWNYLRNIECSYSANFALTGSKIGANELTPLWSVLQQLKLSYVLPAVEINLSGDHYYNEVNNADPINNFFVDLSFRYKLEKWRFTVSMNNLLNKQQYGYTNYSEDRIYSSWIDIRGREFLVAVQYRF